MYDLLNQLTLESLTKLRHKNYRTKRLYCKLENVMRLRPFLSSKEFNSSITNSILLVMVRMRWESSEPVFSNNIK